MEWKLFAFLFITAAVSVHFSAAGKLCDFAEQYPCNGKCSNNSKECPAEFSESFELSCYMVISEPGLSRPQAKAACENVSSHLIFIESEEEDTFIIRILIFPQYQYWLGLNGVNEDRLYWDDGTQLDYINFRGKNSFDGGEGCYKIRDYGNDIYWGDRGCSTSFGYVCEYER